MDASRDTLLLWYYVSVVSIVVIRVYAHARYIVNCKCKWPVSHTRLNPLGGEEGLGIPALIEYPFYDKVTRTQRFPFRTAAMLSALFVQIIASFFTRNLLGKGYFPRCCDVLSVYSPGKTKDQSGVIQSNSGAALMDSSSVNVRTRLFSNVLTIDVIRLTPTMIFMFLEIFVGYRCMRWCQWLQLWTRQVWSSQFKRGSTFWATLFRK